MEQKNKNCIVYEDLTKKEKLKFVKSIHKKLKNHIDLDVHEINFVMSACYGGDISSYLYTFRNVDYEFLTKNADLYCFDYIKVFCLFYLDSRYWKGLTTIVNKYVRIQDDWETKFKIVNDTDIEWAYRVNCDIPYISLIKLQEKAGEIYERETKKYRDEEKKIEEDKEALYKAIAAKILGTNTELGELSDKGIDELFNNEDENQSNLEM